MYADSDFDRGPGIGRPRSGVIPAPSEEDRTPFGQKRKPILETENTKRQRWARESEETHALLERLAAEMLPQAATEEDGWIEKAAAEYGADRAGYSFGAKVNGGFLTVFITRGANTQAEHPLSIFGGKPFPREHSETFCVAGCAPPRLIEGHGPDMGGELTFGYACEYEKGGATIGGTSFGNYAAPKGAQWVVRRPSEYSYCRAPHGRQLFATDAPPERERRIINIDDDSYSIKTVVSPAARFSEDDRVRFDDIGRTIFAPAGMGEMVIAKISAAMTEAIKNG